MRDPNDARTGPGAFRYFRLARARRDGMRAGEPLHPIGIGPGCAKFGRVVVDLSPWRCGRMSHNLYDRSSLLPVASARRLISPDDTNGRHPWQLSV